VGLLICMTQHINTPVIRLLEKIKSTQQVLDLLPIPLNNLRADLYTGLLND
jgi:hypothetical protein